MRPVIDTKSSLMVETVASNIKFWINKVFSLWSEVHKKYA